jgi:hypothetical protein
MPVGKRILLGELVTAFTPEAAPAAAPRGESAIA